MDRRRALGVLMGLGLGGCAGAAVREAPREPAPEGANFVAGVPYVPTRPEVVDAMLDLARVGREDYVYDLGCGDGRILIAAAKRFGARGFGVDIQPDLIYQAEAQASWEGVSDRVSFALHDLFDLDLRPATVVMLYLSVEINLRLRPRMLAELRPGARIVSNRFDMGDVWKPERTVMAAGTPVHLWRVPGRRG